MHAGWLAVADPVRNRSLESEIWWALVLTVVLSSNCIWATPLRSRWLALVIILSINRVVICKTIYFTLFHPGLSQNVYDLSIFYSFSYYISSVNLSSTNHLLHNWVYMECKPYAINISYNYASVLMGEITRNLYLMEKGGDGERITTSSVC